MHYLSIAAIFKQENPWLVEWLDYHLARGAEHFYLYNNDDDTTESDRILKPYVEQGIVDNIHTPGRCRQLTCMADVVTRFKKGTHWMALIDLDEFILPRLSDDLREVLQEYELFSGLGIHWNIFGSNGYLQRPPNQMDCLLHRAENSHPQNMHVKIIVQPKYVIPESIENPHHCRYDSGHAVDEKYRMIDSPFGDYTGDIIRINHYVVRSMQDVLEVKIPRKRADCFLDKDPKKKKHLKPSIDTICCENNTMYHEIFEKVYVINLARRRERWELFNQRFPGDWPFKPPVRYDAIDGCLTTAPLWWQGGHGAWGCYKTHLRILEDCLNQNISSVLILEDDAVCIDGFREKTEQFLQHLPDDWEMVYLGGEHLQEDIRLPRKVNDWVYQPFNVNRCHCYGFRGSRMMTQVYLHLNDFQNWNAFHHVDHYLGELQKKLEHGLYVPQEWLVAQSEGESDICSQTLERRLFPGAEEIIRQKMATSS